MKKLLRMSQRYAQLVDRIFKGQRKAGSCQEDIDKLLFFVMSSPEKLDRISNRLFSRLLVFLKNHNNNMILLTLEVANQLLNACRSSFLNLMMDDYFKILLKLFTHPKVEFQILACKSFGIFSTFDVDTPKFADYLSLFVREFSRMSLTSSNENDSPVSIRQAGLAAIQALISKARTSHIYAFLWNSDHLKNLVPALLLNLRTVPTDCDDNIEAYPPLGDEVIQYYKEAVSASPKNAPAVNLELADISVLTAPFSSPAILVALNNMKDLIVAANVTNSTAVISPIYEFWTQNHLWAKRDASVRMIQLVSQALQPQLTHTAIKLYFAEIEKNMHDQDILVSMMLTLPYFCINTSATMASPICIEVFSYLVTALQNVTFTSRETPYFDSLVEAIEILVDNLPNFQKSESYQMLLNKAPLNFDGKRACIENLVRENSEPDILQTDILLTCLLRISTSYDVTQIGTVLDLPFLNRLACAVVIPSYTVKLNGLRVLTVLFDRHHNVERIVRFLKSNSFEELVETDSHDLTEATIKRTGEFLESIVRVMFESQPILFPSLFMELATLLCVACVEINDLLLHTELVAALTSLKVDPRLDDILQPLAYAVANCVAVVAKNNKLLDLCHTIKEKRKRISLNFWLPSFFFDDSLLPAGDVAADVDGDAHEEMRFSAGMFKNAFFDQSVASDDETGQTERRHYAHPRQQFTREDSDSSLANSSGSFASASVTTRTCNQIHRALGTTPSIINRIGFMRRDRGSADDQDMLSQNSLSEAIMSDERTFTLPPLGKTIEDEEYLN